MAGELAPRQNQAVSITVSLSSPLRQAVNDTPIYGDSGFEVNGTTWRAPSRITTAMIAEAKRRLPDADAACAMTTQEGMARWVASLGMRCRSTPDPEQAKIQVMSYVQGFEHAKIPGAAFTQNTLEKAAEKFTFFPAYSELVEFLSRSVAPLTRLAFRLRVIAESKPTIEEKGNGKAWNELTQEEKDAIDGKLSAVKDRLMATALPRKDR